MNQPNNNSDFEITYQKLINSFYELYPDKKNTVKISGDEIKNFLKTFASKNREKSQYFSLLVKRDPKYFKGIGFTLIPKIKMEVVLSTTSKNDVLNEMWDTIWLLYLLSESEHESPDTVKMSKIATLLEASNSTLLCSEPVNQLSTSSTHNPDIENNVNELLNSFKNSDLNGDVMNDMLKSFKDGNFNKDSLKGVLDGVMSNQELSNNMKNIMATMGIDGDKVSNPSEKSNKFVSDILGDLKSKFKLETVNGKIDSKKFVEQLMDIGTSIGDSYSNKLKSNEISINDILGAVTSMATNPQDDALNELSNSLQLDKLDLPEVLSELKSKMDGKIPPELMNSLGGISGLGGEGLKNIDIGSLIGSMMNTQKDGPVQELTAEQQKELEKYYEDIEL